MCFLKCIGIAAITMYLYYLNAAKAEYFKNPSGPPAIGPITARPMTLVSYHIGYFFDTIYRNRNKEE